MLKLGRAKGHGNVVNVLIRHGANVNATALNGAGPLFAAIGNGHTAIVEMLIQTGADVNAPTSFGAHPEPHTPWWSEKCLGGSSERRCCRRSQEGRH